MAKTDSAGDAIARINPACQRGACIALRLDAGNIAQADLAATTSSPTAPTISRRAIAVADACAAEQRPLVHAAVGRFDGSVTVLKPFESGPDGQPNPSYRDLFPEPPPAGLVPSCAEAGILGALTGVIGTLQAMEVIKLITGIGEPLVGRLLLYDALAARFDTIRYKRRAMSSDALEADDIRIERMPAGFRPLGRAARSDPALLRLYGRRHRPALLRASPDAGPRCAKRPREETGFLAMGGPV